MIYYQKQVNTDYGQSLNKINFLAILLRISNLIYQIDTRCLKGADSDNRWIPNGRRSFSEAIIRQFVVLSWSL